MPRRSRPQDGPWALTRAGKARFYGPETPPAPLTRCAMLPSAAQMAGRHGEVRLNRAVFFFFFFGRARRFYIDEASKHQRVTR